MYDRNVFRSEYILRAVCGAFLILTTYFLLLTDPAYAQDRLSLTVTPPIYKVSIAPGTEWKSTLKILNTNQDPITLHARVVSFKPNGETGQADFGDIFSDVPPGENTLASWVTVEGGEMRIAADRAYDMPVTITVPPDASPGGHYAAILVGSEAPKSVPGGGAAIGTYLSSLILLTVPGEVVEEGSIRDFYAERGYVGAAKNTFILRFENRGNVHIVPQGEITIKNMWGKTRGKIAVNEKNAFGNILPNTTRKFSFGWEGDGSVFDIGRYGVEAVLAFGEEGRQSAVRKVHFWILPWKPVSSIVLGLTAFLWFFNWAIRRYVRRALALERERLGLEIPERGEARKEKGRFESVQDSGMPKVTFAVLKQPIVRGAVDLKGVKSGKEMPVVDYNPQLNIHDESVWSRAGKYRLFFGSVGLLMVGFSLIGWYFVEVFRAERAYTVEPIREK